ncbi:hypothetical protein ALC62_06939 [Cyphomyrmex costatus]|uniref:Endonuclease/exonuclease/phosphatase domain-containing protein n=1 Tax=Cyphomyrmex costatus TaxID=456900 RepID=A0A151II65_9HYME|nr:hypothetical protein ALC62_06939 [Cyphomyrmex costatus]
MSSNEWQSFVNAVVNRGDDFIIGGDFNAYHFSWGSNHNCHNGNVIYNSTDPDNCIILNNGNITHVSGPNFSSSCIDLTFVSPALALDCEWKVENNNWRSDHYPISIFVDTRAEYIPRNLFRINTRLIDWDKYHEFWESNAYVFNSLDFLNSSVCDRYSFLVNQINTAIERSLPIRKTKSIHSQNNNINDNNNKKKKNKIPAIWWNEKCEKANRLSKAKWLSLQFKITREEFLNYKKAFKKFCESII